MAVRNLTAGHLLLMVIGILFKISISNAVEIQTIGYLGAEGQLNVDFLTEDNFLGELDANGNIDLTKANNAQKRDVSQENLELLFHTFIYHPNFIKFDLGFGFVFTQNKVQDFETDATGTDIPSPERKANDKALDLSFRMSFFEQKDYPFSFFYSRKHPPINAVTADALVSENTRYGANFLWNAPIRLTLDILHQDTQGESSLRVLNDQVDSTTLSAYKSYKNDGHMQVSYAHQVQESKSGSTLVPVVESKNTLDDVTFDSRYNFGDEREYTFNFIANYRQNRDSFEYDEIIISPTFNWTHSEKLQSNYRYSYNNNVYADIKSTVHAFDAGIAYTENEGFSTRFDVDGIRSEFTGASTNVYGIKNTSSYRHQFKHAHFSITTLLGYNNSDTITDYTGPGVKATENILMPVRGDYTVLKARNIVAGTIKVFDFNNVQTEYIENIHYAIRDLGNGKYDIETLDKPKPKAGDKVQITYLVDPGQDNQFRRTVAGVNTSLQFFNYFSVYGGTSKSKVDILEGTVSNTLVTDRKVFHTGATIDYPLFENLLTVGAETRRETTEEQTETSATKTDTVLDLVYMQIYLFRGASLYVSGRNSTVAYSGINNSNDVDRTGYRALLKIRTSQRSNLSLVYDDSEDIGNIDEIKELTETTFQFEWGYRRILFRASGSKLIDQRGTRYRERTAVQFNLVRTF